MEPFHPSIPTYIDPDSLVNRFDVTEEARVQRNFSNEEILDMKTQHFELISQITAREGLAATLKSVAVDYADPAERLAYLVNNEKLKEDYGMIPLKGLKSNATDLLQLIHKGYEMVLDTVWGIKFWDQHRMAYYSRDGHFVKDRPLRDNEMQLSLPNG